MSEFSHYDERGRARMVDVSHQPEQKRTARAQAKVQLSAETLRKLREGLLPKGNPLEVVRIAGIQAAKRTSDLIPLCHPLALTQVDVTVLVTDAGVEIESLIRHICLPCKRPSA